METSVLWPQSWSLVRARARIRNSNGRAARTRLCISGPHERHKLPALCRGAGWGRPGLCLPAELSLGFWQQERGHGVLHQIGHQEVLGCHIEERNPSTVVEGAITDGQAGPKWQAWDLTDIKGKKDLFNTGLWADFSWELSLRLWPENRALGMQRQHDVTMVLTGQEPRQSGSQSTHFTCWWLHDFYRGA